LFESGWPQRWINVDQSPHGNAEAWNTTDQRSYRIDGNNDGYEWLRYQHVVPSQEDWFFLRQGTSLPELPPRQLISDFTAYNTKRTKGDQTTYPLSGRGIHWVGDLAIQCNLKVESESGEIVFELVEGGRRFQCAIDLATGDASLSIDGDSSLGTPKAETKLRGPGRYQVRFANVDDQLRLWVDGREMEFNSATTYEPLGNHVPTEADLLPAGIASRGARMEIRRIRLLRDLYYIAYSSDVNAFAQPLADFDLRTTGIHPTAKAIDLLLSTPEYWSVFDDFRFVEFKLREGEFLALGDNSGESKDSRLWAVEDGVGPEVPRDLLIGKALFIYWPHSEDRIPGTNIPFPFFPNFKRMRVIR
jgi:signal peptidase I